MAEHETSFDEFLALAAPNLDRKCGAVFACIYAQVGSVWTNIAATVVLTPSGDELGGHFAPRLFDIEGVRAVRVVIPADGVLPLLRGIIAGSVSASCLPEGCDDIRFVGRKDGGPYKFGSSAGDIRDLTEFGLALRGHVLQSSGDTNAELLRHERWREVSSRLPASSPPFKSLTAVGLDLRICNCLEHNDLTSVVLISPYWLTLSRAEIRHDDASIDVVIESRWDALGTDATLSLLPDVEFLEHKQLVVVGDAAWKSAKEGEWTLFQRRLPVGRAIGPADLSLNFAGRQIESATVGIANARVVAHELIDSEFRNLRSRLFERKNNSDDARQEEGVAWLLHLCGLSVVRYGYKDLQRATDVVAFLGDAAAIYAECSLELPPMEKLKNIESRAESLRTRLKENYGRTITLVRAIFVPQKRADLAASEPDDAHEHARAIYICRDDQEQLIEMARRGESPEHCFFFIAQRGREYATAAL